MPVLIGEKALDLSYRGGEGKPEKSEWIHTFETPVQILGMEDGSVRLESRTGKPLWGDYPVDKKDKGGVPFLENPQWLAVANRPKRRKKRKGKKKGARKVARRRKTRRRRYSRPRRRYYRPRARYVRRRRNATVAKRSNRRYRRRRNPRLLPTGMARQALALGAGFLAAPMIANLIPYQPATQVGEYIKKTVGVILGAQVISLALSRKVGNALLAGGMISVAVDVLRNYVPVFGGGMPAPANNGGVGYYFPTDAELSLNYGNVNVGNGEPVPMLPAPEGFHTGTVNRFSSRFC